MVLKKKLKNKSNTTTRQGGGQVALQENKKSFKKMKYIEFKYLLLTSKTINHGNKKCVKWYLERIQSFKELYCNSCQHQSHK